MNILNSDIIYWYDEDNSVKILASAAPLGLDKDTGSMLDQNGNVVAKVIG